jgi:hypothetical protein
MSMHEEVAAAIQREISVFDAQVEISPSLIAAAVLSRFAGGKLDPRVQYVSLEQLKAMARRVLAGRYEADSDDNVAHQGELFSGHLQERYPTPRARGSDAIYKLREHLTSAEVAWNIGQLRKSAAARLRHADALQAWSDEHFSAPAQPEPTHAS